MYEDEDGCRCGHIYHGEIRPGQCKFRNSFWKGVEVAADMAYEFVSGERRVSLEKAARADASRGRERVGVRVKWKFMQGCACETEGR